MCVHARYHPIAGRLDIIRLTNLRKISRHHIVDVIIINLFEYSKSVVTTYTRMNSSVLATALMKLQSSLHAVSMRKIVELLIRLRLSLVLGVRF